MSQYDVPPMQPFRSELGAAPGTPGPLGAPVPDSSEFGGLPADARMLPPPPGPGDEVDVLKSMIVAARDYIDIPTVDESERLEMEKVTTIPAEAVGAEPADERPGNPREPAEPEAARRRVALLCDVANGR